MISEHGVRTAEGALQACNPHAVIPYPHGKDALA